MHTYDYVITIKRVVFYSVFDVMGCYEKVTWYPEEEPEKKGKSED
jgi:hypothetical protein